MELSNLKITDLTDFRSLYYVGGLILDSNPNLTTTRGLETERLGVNGIKITQTGNVIIRNNDQLLNLDGLNEIEHINRNSGSLIIENNANLTNVDGVRNLKSIASNLVVRNNGSLTNIDGFTMNFIGGEITIENNSNLSSCCGFLNTIQRFFGPISMSDNAGNCNNNGTEINDINCKKEIKNFGILGNIEIWTIPPKVSEISVEVKGGDGGTTGGGGNKGGTGAIAKSTFKVTPGSQIEVVVGGRGGFGNLVGGGGGGSGIRYKDTILVVAGAGGGGNAGSTPSSNQAGQSTPFTSGNNSPVGGRGSNGGGGLLGNGGDGISGGKGGFGASGGTNENTDNDFGNGGYGVGGGGSAQRLNFNFSAGGGGGYSGGNGGSIFSSGAGGGGSYVHPSGLESRIQAGTGGGSSSNGYVQISYPFVETICRSDNYLVENDTIISDTYKATLKLSAASIIKSKDFVVFQGGQSVELLPGFQVPDSTNFQAILADCSQENSYSSKENAREQILNATPLLDNFQTKKVAQIIIFPNPNNGKNTNLQVNLVNSTEGQITLHDNAGRQLSLSTNQRYQFHQGMNEIELRHAPLLPGIYFINVTTANERFSQKMIVLK